MKKRLLPAAGDSSFFRLRYRAFWPDRASRGLGGVTLFVLNSVPVSSLKSWNEPQRFPESLRCKIEFSENVFATFDVQIAAGIYSISLGKQFSATKDCESSNMVHKRVDASEISGTAQHESR